MSNILEVRRQFPLLEAETLAYLDSASTTQKPEAVIAAMDLFYRSLNANIHRGIYHLSQQATDAYEAARESVRDFIGASDAREVVFVRGTTEAMNLVAHSFLRPRLQSGDEVVVTEMEHHSNIVPWQIVCAEKGAHLQIIPITDNGELDVSKLHNFLSSKTKLLSVSHVSNTLGTINPIKEIIHAAQAKNIPVCVDGAQAIAHVPINVQELNCEFYAFSTHKAYGPLGTGILYGKLPLLNTMPPYQGGGDMILSVSFEKTEFQEAPQRFEAGTPHIAGPIAFAESIKFLRTLGWDTIQRHEATLGELVRTRLREIPGVTIIGEANRRIGIISFTLSGVHPHDIGTILDQHNVAIRTGHHCTQPLMDRLRLPATARISLGVYNNVDDIERLMSALKHVRKIFPHDGH